jgi:hypothetical protein
MYGLISRIRRIPRQRDAMAASSQALFDRRAGARRGIGWSEQPWIPPIKGTAMRNRKV